MVLTNIALLDFCIVYFIWNLADVRSEYQHQQYVVSNDSVNWYQALINCKNMGMELASVHSEEEQAALETYLTSNKYYLEEFWMGATNEGNDQFYWVPTGARMVYSKFLIGQPDNYQAPINYFEGEHCLAWGKPKEKDHPLGWEDLTCFKSYRYICQKQLYCNNKLL